VQFAPSRNLTIELQDLMVEFGVAGQFMYNGLGVSRGVLQEFSVPDGNANVWSITAEPRRRPSPHVLLALYC